MPLHPVPIDCPDARPARPGRAGRPHRRTRAAGGRGRRRAARRLALRPGPPARPRRPGARSSSSRTAAALPAAPATPPPTWPRSAPASSWSPCSATTTTRRRCAAAARRRRGAPTHCVTEPGRADRGQAPAGGGGAARRPLRRGPRRPAAAANPVAAGRALDAVLRGGPGRTRCWSPTTGSGRLAAAVRAALGGCRTRIPLLVVDARVPGGLGGRCDPTSSRPTPPRRRPCSASSSRRRTGRAGRWRTAAPWSRRRGGADVSSPSTSTGRLRLPADPAAGPRRTAAHPGAEARACGAGDTFTATYTGRAGRRDPRRRRSRWPSPPPTSS